MADPDLKDKPVTSNEPTDADHWTDDTAATHGDYDEATKKQQEQQKNKQTERSRAFRDAKKKQFKQKVKQQAVKEGKKVAKKVVQKVAETGADQANAALITGASGGTLAPIAEPAGKVMTKAEELTVKAGVEVGKDLWNPQRVLEYPEKIEKQAKSWGKIIGVICLCVITLILIAMLLLSGATPDLIAEETAYHETNPVTISKTGPAVVDNPADRNYINIAYEISATYNGIGDDLKIHDELPPGFEFVSASGKYELVKEGAATKVVTWSARENGLANGAGPTTFKPFTASVTLKTAQQNVYVRNNAYASIDAAQGVPAANLNTAYVAPTQNNCGTYAASMSKNYLLSTNWGDPACDFSKESLALLIKEKDPNYLYEWFDVIVKYESGYNPNAIALPDPGSQQAAIDKCGAWGLYQMGSSYRTQPSGNRECDPGKTPPSPGLNGEYDRGDVNWQVQTTNAILDNRLRLHCNFRYYSTACNQNYTGVPCFWGKYSC